MTAEADLRVEQEILIRAPIERVFKAFTDPLELATWWRIPGYYETEHADVDLRVGGRYRLTGTSAGLSTFEVHGEYLVIEPPSVLSYTWNPSWDRDAHGSVVDIRLESVGDETRVRVVHTAFLTANARDEHDQGWPAVLQAVVRHCEVA